MQLLVQIGDYCWYKSGLNGLNIVLLACQTGRDRGRTSGRKLVYDARVQVAESYGHHAFVIDADLFARPVRRVWNKLSACPILRIDPESCESEPSKANVQTAIHSP